MNGPPRRASADDPDIRGREDVRRVVDAFYEQVVRDPDLAPYFRNVDLDSHRPRMYDFWSTVLFQTGAYHGSPFFPHAHLPGLTAEHFLRWLALFTHQVDAHFAGEMADRMKASAERIATTFQAKLGLAAPAGELQSHTEPRSHRENGRDSSHVSA